MSNIAIIGAGVTGVTTAHALMQRGFNVTVFERNRYAAMETSFANGGQLSASNAEVWNSAATVLKGLRWMLKRDAPLLVNPTPTWHKYSWICEFLAQIPHYRQNTLETVRLSLMARDFLFQVAEQEGISFDLERRGILHVYKTRAEFERASRVNQLLKEGGLDRQPIEGSEIGRVEPAIDGEFYGGFFTPSDCTGDIHKFTRGLAGACERAGTVFHYDSHVRSIARGRNDAFAFDVDVQGEKRRLTFDQIVVCAGVHSRRFAAMLGDRLNIYPVKGYSITVHLDDNASRAAAPWVSLLDDNAKIVTSRLGVDRFRVAGTAELNGFDRTINMDRVRPLVDWTRRYFPGICTARIEPWSGLRPMLPNMLPRVGRGKAKGVFYNTGHGHLGWTMSAATAQILAADVEPLG